MMPKNPEKTTKSGTTASINDSLKKATTEMLVLFVLRQKSMYTYEMMSAIESLSEGRLSFNTLYQAIYRLRTTATSRSRKRYCPKTTECGSTFPSPRRGKSTWRPCVGSIRALLTPWL